MKFTPEQTQSIKALYSGNLPVAEVDRFICRAEAAGLNPLNNEIYLIPRNGRGQITVGIDGIRLLSYQADPDYGSEIFWKKKEDSEWSDTCSGTPYAARCVVTKGKGRVVARTALWDEYGRGQGNLWRSKPNVMLAKVAEATALRAAYPQRLAGLYETAELGDQPQPQPREGKDKGKHLRERADNFQRNLAAQPKPDHASGVVTTPQPRPQPQPATITTAQAEGLREACKDFSTDARLAVKRVLDTIGVQTLDDVPVDAYAKVQKVVEEHRIPDDLFEE